MIQRNAIKRDNNDPVSWAVHDALKWLWWRVKFVLAGLVVGVVLGYTWRMVQTGGF